MRWAYRTDTIRGNLHDVAEWLNSDRCLVSPLDIVAVERGGEYITILWRAEACAVPGCSQVATQQIRHSQQSPPYKVCDEHTGRTP